MSEVLAVSQDSPLQTCKKCNLAIFEGHAYELGEDRWHIGCFKCFKCETLLGCNSNFLVLGNGSLVCSNCSYSCKQCGKKIDDLAILTGDQAYCSSCFKCRVCKVKIEDLRYARTSKGLFCMSCHEDLIAKKRKHDLKRKQLALLMLLLRPLPSEDLSPLLNVSSVSSRLSTTSGSPHTNQHDMYLHPNPSLSSTHNKLLPPHPESRSSGASPSATDSLAQTTPSAVSSSTTIESSPALHGPEMTSQASYLMSPAPSLKQKSASTTENKLLSLVFPKTPFTLHPNPSYDIEEVNDSDDELHLRKVRENLERRFMKQSDEPDGAILDLIDSFSAPNTPSTIYNHPETNGSSGSARQANQEQASPHKNILLRSPNQFHDNEFHNADNIHDEQPISVLPEEKRRSNFPITSPMAKVNRQARVVETNDKNSNTDLGLETKSPARQQNEKVLSTPKKKLTSSKSPHLSSPAPHLMLPGVPLTPKQNGPEMQQRHEKLGEMSEPKGLGLEGFDLPKTRTLKSATPTVTNLENLQREEPDYDDFQKSPPSRKTSVKNLLLNRHKRSTSSSLGGGLSGKLGMFKSKDEPDLSKGHTRHALEGSFNGQAFTTPPLPLTSPMVQISRRDSHTRDFEMRSIKFEIYQLDSRRQALLAENMKLNSDKSKLLEALNTLLKRVTQDTQAKELLSLEVKELTIQKSKLKEENESLILENKNLQESTWRSRELIREPKENHASQAYDHHNETFESNNVLESINDEGAEAQKATRLKFWRRPKVTITNTQAQQHPSQLLSSSMAPAQSQGSIGDESSGPRKALNSLTGKSRSSGNIDLFGNGSNGKGHTDVPLLNSTLQRRAAFENEKVPLIITKCIEEVEKRGLDMEGIYRLSGGNTAISAIEHAFAGISTNGVQEKKQMAKLNEVLSGDINAVTSAFKRYLRKLPDPLVPFASYDAFVRIGQRKADASELCNEFKTRIINRLPPANKHTMYMIVKHLNKVNQYSNVNRMTYKNLSVVFAPTIARDVTGEREMMDMGPRNEATELLFSNFDTLFSDYVEEH
ncbi:RhoGAP-domain-containing protein [Metschnikowia bicuspidata var. bicuspidata NRRL YB-4993]|uniref:RhoGAP-domain-containing protein n=1 Tax=Metschnikowia bicuspidata var. bicuspidata NRRL YB-4993 TaxID=869754 RepID=A0A1A0HH00_9ASCO|nr:RhoGAP-domain-containing protein [Metschnikowia bicuspidata var. bicuspidata NRRL YB-4993]OBA23157.1 RhoGAP-domain-containing protein [Metschnikowia bicuspidata var. bicuspidata NRRL YB-4993]